MDLELSLVTPFVVLLGFYLYALVKPQVVKRMLFFCIGALGVLLSLVAMFFTVGGNPARDIYVVYRILNVIGMIVAFLGAFAIYDAFSNLRKVRH